LRGSGSGKSSGTEAEQREERMKKQMEVFVAPDAGLCFGVKRALELVQLALRKKTSPIYSLGGLIHNPQVVEDLRKRGLDSAAGLDGVDGGTVVIPSHGVSEEILREASERGLEVVDTTCPFVERAQQVAAELSRAGYHVAVVGDAAHPEVQGILGHCRGEVTVIPDEGRARRFARVRKLGILAQTTVPPDRFRKIVSLLASKATDVKIHNTICATTAKRIAGAVQLAETVDVMLIVGGKRSANTTRLWEKCLRVNGKSFHIESPDDLDSGWFKGASRVGVTGGASTPDWVIEQVVAKLKNMG